MIVIDSTVLFSIKGGVEWGLVGEGVGGHCLCTLGGPCSLSFRYFLLCSSFTHDNVVSW